MTTRSQRDDEVAGAARGMANVLVAFVVVATTVGCGDRDMPKLGRVSGTVTLDGAPLAGAFVEFRPDRGRPSSCRTDAAGRYRPLYIRGIEGVCLGPGTVLITTARDEQPATAPDALPVAAAPETLPARYHAESSLKVEVLRGTNTFDFALESEP